MKVLILVSLVALSLANIPRPQARDDKPQPIESHEDYGDMDPDDNLTEEEFEKVFDLDPVTDPEEKAKREEALKKAEEEVKEENEKFEHDEAEWWEEIQEWSDLTKEEFEEQKTGDKEEHGRGLVEPKEAPVDEKSERYFSALLTRRGSAPASYSAVDAGLVSPVTNQKQCGSCVAFASMAAIETCFKKTAGGDFGDYSEQQLVDCGYGSYGASGCNGASSYSYIKYVAEKSLDLTHESTYPYLNTAPKLTCPTTAPYNRGARVSSSYYTYSGTEEKLKQAVYEHGAVVTTVAAAGPFSSYGGGVFSGCTSSSTDHAVTVVGYGTSGGEDYWLIKNSWGTGWGEGGFIRLKRGVGMCGVGSAIAVPICEKVLGATSPPLTTEKPCVDKYSNCPSLALTNCKKHGEDCAKSCGLCEGMTPVASNTCPDAWNNCATLAQSKCYKDWMKTDCCMSCGLGAGMTPAASNTCWDRYSNCADLCSWYADDCKKSCSAECK